MTKKELLAKLDELGGKIEEVKSVLKQIEPKFQDALDELSSVSDIFVDELPQEIDEIVDDTVVTEE